MKILERYIFGQLLRNLIISVAIFTMLFLIFDFFDRIDNILAENAGFFTAVQYFLYKIPLTVMLILPIAMLVSTLFTIGMLSKNSEVTAMRASGITVFWIARPAFLLGISLSLLSIVFNETVVPYSTRREKEIYNIDIRQKDKRGGYSQSDFWWRTGNTFYSVGMFDSRLNELLNFSRFDVTDDFTIARRVDAERATFVEPLLGWTMKNVSEYRFNPNGTIDVKLKPYLPLPIQDTPETFYDVKTDKDTMSFTELRRFIKKQSKNGIPITGYLADLNEKIAFPFINFIVTLVVLPFALKPARSGSLAISFLAGLVIGFSYYAVHSFSIALGRAEIWPPLLAAWMANLVMGFIGLVLHFGAESPS